MVIINPPDGNNVYAARCMEFGDGAGIGGLTIIYTFVIAIVSMLQGYSRLMPRWLSALSCSPADR